MGTNDTAFVGVQRERVMTIVTYLQPLLSDDIEEADHSGTGTLGKGVQLY